MQIKNEIKKADKLINRLIFESRKFVWYAAFQYGKHDYLLSGEKTAKFAYDYEYFAFTKSTKTLISIRELLKNRSNEDVLILLRSIFEHYLACRYFNENDDKIDNFIFIPYFLAARIYYYDNDLKIVDRTGNQIDGKLLNPNELQLGKDKAYYTRFYEYLCRYSHSNYGVIDCYLDEHHAFTLRKDNEPLLTRLFVIFVFTRLFEHVVTVDGEDFIDQRTEKRCYHLVKDSISFQDNLFKYFIRQYSSAPAEDTNSIKKQKWMREMLKGMKKSLSEEIGSLKKDFIEPN